MAQAQDDLPESAVRRRGSEGTHEGAGRGGYRSTRLLPRVTLQRWRVESPTAATTPQSCGVGNPDILRVDGSCLSSRVPFTVRTMSERYHARKGYPHYRFPADHSLLVEVLRNDMSTSD